MMKSDDFFFSPPKANFYLTSVWQVVGFLGPQRTKIIHKIIYNLIQVVNLTLKFEQAHKMASKS